MRGGNFLKIQWCCISKVVQLDNLVLSTELIMQIGNCKEFLRLPFCELTIILFINPSWWLVYIFTKFLYIQVFFAQLCSGIHLCFQPVRCNYYTKTNCTFVPHIFLYLGQFTFFNIGSKPSLSYYFPSFVLIGCWDQPIKVLV